jgi:hypothetical protein
MLINMVAMAKELRMKAGLTAAERMHVHAI